MSTRKTAQQRIKELHADGMPTAKIRAMLTLEDYIAKDINNALKEVGLSKERGESFNAQFYAFLSQEMRSDSDVQDFVKQYGTENAIKHMTHFRQIGDLARDIYSKK